MERPNWVRRHRLLTVAFIVLVMTAGAVVQAWLTRNAGPLAVQRSNVVQDYFSGLNAVGIEPGIISVADRCVTYTIGFGDSRDISTVVWEDGEAAWSASSKSITIGPLSWLGVGDTLSSGQRITGYAGNLSNDWVKRPSDRCPPRYIVVERGQIE